MSMQPVPGAPAPQVPVGDSANSADDIALFDTHCHIHEAPVRGEGEPDATQNLWAKLGHPQPQVLIADARAAGVAKLLCVGCSLADSRRAVALAQAESNVWASIGVHPHEAQVHLEHSTWLEEFAQLAGQPKVVAIGECGLDYFYNHSPREAQIAVLRFQLELARHHDLPMVFHVREAFDDFWPIFDEFPGIRGVIHSFTAGKKELREILARDLFVGLNGITTFMKKAEQLEAIKAVPLEKMVLETDAPFLTPVPYRGTICVPRHVRVVAEFLSDLRDESLETIAVHTTHNADILFGTKEL